MNQNLTLMKSKIYNIAVNRVKLSTNVAQAVLSNNFTKPLCISELTPWKKSQFCDEFYRDYVSLANSSNISINDFPVNDVNLSTESAIDSDIASILTHLHQIGYVPDTFVTLSEYTFDALNTVSVNFYNCSTKRKTTNLYTFLF